MRTPFQLHISVGRSEPLTTDECLELAARFRQSVDVIEEQLRGGALSIPVGLIVGSDPELEPVCRVCGKSKSVLAKQGITLAPFEPTKSGIRPAMEAALPPDHISYWDCLCTDRALAKKAEEDRKELDRRNPISAPYLPMSRAASVDALADLEKRLRSEIARLEKTNAGQS